MTEPTKEEILEGWRKACENYKPVKLTPEEEFIFDQMRAIDKLMRNSKPSDREIAKCINEHFWELV